MDFKLLHHRGTVQSKAIIIFIFVASIVVTWTEFTLADEIPADYVFLKELDPSILQDIRYAGRFNFTGAPLPGYKSAECILHRKAAEALIKAQAEAKENGFLLKAFDCYRPQKATQAFVEWVNGPASGELAEEFFPDIPKSSLLRQKYISTNSTHSLGVAVDVTLVRPRDKPIQTKTRGGGPCNGPLDTRPLESSLDFGTTFDCFATQSHTDYRGTSAQAKQNRNLLLQIMTKYGFDNYRREWWHFQLKLVPKDLKAQNFDIPDRPINQSKQP